MPLALAWAMWVQGWAHLCQSSVLFLNTGGCDSPVHPLLPGLGAAEDEEPTEHT